jgi:transcriptional regulator with XRE-family HTH domain
MSSSLAQPSMSIGDHLRVWRQRRRLSQLDFALQARISQKHLSFIESGRSQPSRDMVQRLAEQLRVPLRESNAMMLAAGFAPVFPERPLDDAALAPARDAIALILKGHEPYPALAVDRHWTILDANSGIAAMLALVQDKTLLVPPVNALKISLSPGGLGPHIVNFAEWRAHILDRLHQQIGLTDDPKLKQLVQDIEHLPVQPEQAAHAQTPHLGGIAVPLQLRTPAGLLSLISTITVFGTPVDVTLSEIALEAFYPANAETAALLRKL